MSSSCATLRDYAHTVDSSLAALDQTSRLGLDAVIMLMVCIVVSTALPVIVTELPGTGYTWIGAAYLL